ncbi:hypothetical protein AB0G79_32430 [Streptomyces sp. NPDC020807]|uniref:hypothetical protein n=1 Tax=Streptomyces sp. NPDC020807 TaxID=3155119 RepID=UPI003410C8F4
MPQNDPQPDPFEDGLGAALRSTGESFTLDGRREIVSAGLARGRRRIVRRRLAVTGGALALAAIGIGGVYGGSVLTPAGKATTTSVAGPATPKPTGTTATAAPGKGSGEPVAEQIPIKDIAAVLKNNTPEGKWEFESLEGTGQHVSAVYDDGAGRAGVTVGFYRSAGGDGEAGSGQVTCPSKVAVPYDHCDEERLPGGARLMILQGYEYPDKREETKDWRAVLLTKDGFIVDVNEYNAPAEKGEAITREDPPFDAAELRKLVTTDDWRPLYEQLAPNVKVKRGPDSAHQPPAQLGGAFIEAGLRSLLPKGLTVVEAEGEDGYGYMVVDDGQGKSLVQINVQYGMGGADGLFTGDVTTLPDGRKVKLTRQPGEKGGSGVVWWTVDTITPEGLRVVVSAFNTGAQHEDATRAEPALTMDQLKTIALSGKWQTRPAQK